jgi:predicted lipoprotein with Yx(FWY)xxD motif
VVQPPAPIIGANLALGIDSSKAFGTYLIGFTGMTVYVNAGDTGTTSTCTGECARTWLPYIVSSTDNINQLQAGVKGKVGTSTRADGTLQLTYKGHPLYFYSGDNTGSDTKGNGLDGVWSVVKP